ncbi:MAG: NAD(P)H-hydrate dehydratase [Deltaproteobacteria bacterium]|nr:NAD(P)H-hydrate dehydratase [Deltaproteobacteria bacterium]
MQLVTAAEMRALDAATIAAGTPGHVLMERAGQGAVRVLLDCFPRLRRKRRRLLVVAGKGNNGGDGLVIARLLKAKGLVVEVALLAAPDEVGGDAARNLRAWQRGRGRILEVRDAAGVAALAERVERAELIVDAIFGTGLNSPVRGVAADVIALLNASGVPIFAVDIPSGLDADSGQPLGSCIEAEATATFGFAKLGQVIHPGVRLCGRLAVVDIGLDADAIAAAPPRAALLEPANVAPLVPVRERDAHKGDAGHVLILAGSFGKTGAAQLATRAAVRSGAGLTTVVAPLSLYPIYAGGVLEAMTEALPDDGGAIRFAPDRLASLIEGKRAVVIGPGLGTHEGAARTLAWLLAEARVPLVIDADGLTLAAGQLEALRASQAPTVLTPHPGEMARLLGSDTAAVQRDRAGCARRFAAAHGCTLVLKGAHSLIAAADGALWVNPTGNPGMASGGMGDVLAGIVGALLAQGLEPSEAARLGVYVHGLAADRAAANGEIGIVASDLIAGLPSALQAVREGTDA